MIGIVDCNSFYCACERVFRPELMDRPVVVLSNNDGCIIARTAEAKAIGMGMAGPYFKAKPLIEAHGVAVFSSNYNLYGDMSWRVMETIRSVMGTENVEVYSVDECFIEMAQVRQGEIRAVAKEIRDRVDRWTGIKVSVGIAPTKVLAKVANRLAKKRKTEDPFIEVLDNPIATLSALQATAVADVWGVGSRYADRLVRTGITTAYDLSKKDIVWGRKYMGGVVGERLLRELKGERTKELQPPRTVKENIATTRMFGAPVTDLKSIKEAVSTYTGRAAEKLRRQKSAADTVAVFLIASEAQQTGDRFRHGPSVGCHATLPMATSATNELAEAASKLVEHLFEEGKTYKKAGVILSGIVPDTAVQSNLFGPEKDPAKSHRLMEVLDNLNFSMRDDIVKFASFGTKRDWKMQQKLQSKRFTTRWDELCTVK